MVKKHTREMLVALPYFGLMERTLTLKQLRRYLWGTEIDLSELPELLRRLKVQPEDFVFNNRQAEVSQKFWEFVKRNVFWLRFIPFIQFVGVMNSLAHGAVTEGSDIDLFLVTKKNRLWTARGLLMLWLAILGLRAKGKNKACKFSPEFFVDESMLNLESLASANPYVAAFWFADFVPILNSDYFERLWRANSWLKLKLPVAYKSPNLKPEFEKEKGPNFLGRFLEVILGGVLGDRIEAWARGRQINVIERNLAVIGVKPTYIVEHNIVKIHFNDLWPEQVERRIAEFLGES